MTCRLEVEAIRRDWHLYLASLDPQQSSAWSFSYRYWRGFLQRDASMTRSATLDFRKPAIVLVHGFGGSIEQYTGLAEQLKESFNVFALDSLGFGRRSPIYPYFERPP